MIVNRIKIKKRNQVEIEVHLKSIIIKNIVIIHHHHHHHHHHQIHLNHVQKKRKNHIIMINILNIINRKNMMIEDENIKINLCSVFFLYDIIKLKNNI